MIHSSGRIEVICGSMFCGKSEELIRRSRRAVIAKQALQVFKPSIDDRYSVLHVSSHSGQNIEAQAIAKAHEILSNLNPTTTVVAVDEVQFFDLEIVRIVQELAARGIRVILAGLDMDFRGEPFGPMPLLLSIAEDVTKLHAICVICGEDACRTQRLVNGDPARYDDPIIMVGAQEAYEARCRKHHLVPR
ncbi:MAG: thymidine kinase [Chloroflexi bacterium]|nr:thymidine kinase [Chloroflexota bacterium]MCC6891239.1 thymidine kinase [Anaerolineae bacterium]